MTRPGSHNDTYVSTCHRMFFANWHHKKLPASECPDNDQHNVDTVDGLVLPTITALASALSGTKQDAAVLAAATASVTRNSPALDAASRLWADVVFDSVHGDLDASLPRAASLLGIRLQPSAEMVS